MADVRWGEITGTLSNQTDLDDTLAQKTDLGHTHLESDITDLNHLVKSVNTMIGEVTITPSNIQAAPEVHAHTEYYTKSESNTTFAPKQHNHDVTDISNLDFPVDSVNGHFGVVVLDHDDVSAAPAVHNHDSAYYTKSYVNLNFAKTSHNHNSSYYTKGQADSKYLGKTARAYDSDRIHGYAWKRALNYMSRLSNGISPDDGEDPYFLSHHADVPIPNGWFYIQNVYYEPNQELRYQIAINLQDSPSSLWFRVRYVDKGWSKWYRADNNDLPNHTISTSLPSGGKPGDVWFVV